MTNGIFHFQCTFVFLGTLSSLNRHIEGRHEGKRFSCDLCDYTVMNKNNLKEHKATKHLGKCILLQAEEFVSSYGEGLSVCLFVTRQSIQ